MQSPGMKRCHTADSCVHARLPSQIFSSYIYLLTGGSNSDVGYITGLSGLAQVNEEGQTLPRLLPHL